MENGSKLLLGDFVKNDRFELNAYLTCLVRSFDGDHQAEKMGNRGTDISTEPAFNY